MDIKQLNKRYYLQREMGNHTLNGLSSTLSSYENGIMQIKVFVNSNWNRSYQVAAYQVAHAWKKGLPELRNAIGCKVFIYDIHKQVNDNNLLKESPSLRAHAKKGILFGPNQLN